MRTRMYGGVGGEEPRGLPLSRFFQPEGIIPNQPDRALGGNGYMQNASFDPGLTTQVIAPLRRIINKDGQFNVHRRGTTWRDFHPYLHLINLGWPRFLSALFMGYLVSNCVFAVVYFALGPDQLAGADAPTAWGRFLNDFFFSAHTLSTVGYGNISPRGMAGNVVAAFEALVGVLSFAVATGLLFGRVSRPSAKIGYSENMVVAPYQDGTSLQFRVVNRRANSLMELEAKVMVMTVDGAGGKDHSPDKPGEPQAG